MLHDGRAPGSWAASARVDWQRWIFVDDIVFQAAPDAVPRALARYENLCTSVGIELVRPKCKAYWPACAQAVRDGGPQLQPWLAAHQPVVAAVTDAVQIAENASRCRGVRVCLRRVHAISPAPPLVSRTRLVRARAV